MPDPTPKRVAIPIELHWNVPWHLDCFQGIMDYGHENGWACVVDPYLDGPTGDGDLSGYDGVVGRIDNANAARIKDLGLPCVNLLLTNVDLGLHSVRVDAVAGTRLAGEHLIAHGYRRFGHASIVPWNKSYSDPIQDTFEQTIVSHGYPPPTVLHVQSSDLEHPETSKACLQALTAWIDELDKPVGLYVYTFDVARYLAQICTQLGLRIPEDVGILVQDADDVNTTRITPTLSAIDFDYGEQGYQAAAVLDRLMRGERVNPRNTLIAPRRVIVRESTDGFLCDDELVSQAMRYIAEHSRRSMGGEDVAAALQVSRRTLDRRFEQVLGNTLSHAITQARVKQIEATLTESELTMGDIAELFGFGSASLFTQFFKNHAGMTPTAYRQRYRADR